MPLLLHNLVKQQDDCGSELLSIVEHYIQRCCRQYYNLDYGTQQDIAQEVSVKLLLNYEDIKYTISKRWLYVMVKNLCIDIIRKQCSTNQLITSESTQEDDVPPPTMVDFSYSSKFDHHECLENVFAYITAQPTGQEDLTIYSHFAYGLNRAEIAHITGRTVSAITKRISILRSRLKSLRDELC
jgi:RNA polymerase sigma factor (sigma-70 family)